MVERGEPLLERWAAQNILLIGKSPTANGPSGLEKTTVKNCYFQAPLSAKQFPVLLSNIDVRLLKLKTS